MPNTKHKIFSIYVHEKQKIDFDQTVLNTISEFLIEPNIVYISHSIATLSLPLIDYYRIQSYRHFVVISLIYKDLSETELDLSKTTKKTKDLVKRSIETGAAIPMPNIETSFDKRTKENPKKTKN